MTRLCSVSLTSTTISLFINSKYLLNSSKLLLVITGRDIFLKVSWCADNMSHVSFSGLILIVSVKKTPSRFQAWLTNRSALLESASAQDGVFLSLKAWYSSLFSSNASSFISLRDKKLNLFIVW